MNCCAAARLGFLEQVGLLDELLWLNLIVFFAVAVHLGVSAQVERQFELKGNFETIFYSTS